MLTVLYQGVDTVKAGPFTVKWDDQLPDQRLQTGYEALCHRLAHLSLEKFPPSTLSNGQSSFQWLNYFPDQPALLSFIRENETGEDLIFILNRSNEPIKSLTMGVKKEGLYEVLLDSDSLLFVGGREEYLSPYSSKPEPANDCAHSIFIDMPPASALILQREA